MIMEAFFIFLDILTENPYAPESHISTHDLERGVSFERIEPTLHVDLISKAHF